MSCVDSALTSTPSRVFFGGLTLLSCRQAVKAAQASKSESFFQRGVTRLLGETHSSSMQTFRKVGEVAFWLANAALYGTIALTTARCNEDQDCVREPIWKASPESSTGLVSWAFSPLTSLDNVLLGGMGQSTLHWVSNHKLISGAATALGVGSLYLGRNGIKRNAAPAAIAAVVGDAGAGPAGPVPPVQMGGGVGVGAVPQAPQQAQPAPVTDAELLNKHNWLRGYSETARQALLRRPRLLNLLSNPWKRRLWVGPLPDFLDYSGLVKLETVLNLLGFPPER